MRPEKVSFRVPLWGNSLGGAHVISVAADDPAVGASSGAAGATR